MLGKGSKTFACYGQHDLGDAVLNTDINFRENFWGSLKMGAFSWLSTSSPVRILEGIFILLRPSFLLKSAYSALQRRRLVNLAGHGQT